jgi:hypothetical protein
VGKPAHGFTAGKEIEEAVAMTKAIADSAGDYEIAHSMEDELMRRALECILDGFKDPAVLANIALSTGDLNFPRYCA